MNLVNPYISLYFTVLIRKVGYSGSMLRVFRLLLTKMATGFYSPEVAHHSYNNELTYEGLLDSCLSHPQLVGERGIYT